MSPTFRLLLPLLYLLHLLFLLQPAEVNSESSKPERQIGKEFLVTFPEIIAHYHPTRPSITIQAAVLFGNTNVVTSSKFDKQSSAQVIAKASDFAVNENMELAKEEISNKTVRITSDKDIVVFATSQKNNSMQTVLVVPTDTLATRYFIPAVPTIKDTTSPASIVTMEVTERSPFRIIIVNAGAQNEVTVKGKKDKEISLSPYEVAQVWLDEDKEMEAVEAEAPVAVFFGHPCANRKPCTCGQLYTMVPPAKEGTADFVIPPFLADAGLDETAVLVTDGSGVSTTKPYDNNSPVVKQASAAIFYSPGLLVPLIPESDFASCYIVSAIPNIPSYVVIMAKTDETDGVNVGTEQVTNWEDVKNTDYKAVRHELPDGRSVIWHSYSKMAVYLIGNNDGNQFGQPAPIVSTTPDYRGCAVVPESLDVGDSAEGWREALKKCLDVKKELASFSSDVHLKQVHKQLAQWDTEELEEVWIGMRRSALTGEWYWANNGTVDATNWGEDEPGSVEDGQCVMMSMRKDEDFTWRDEDCCMRAKYLCIGPGKFIKQ